MANWVGDKHPKSRWHIFFRNINSSNNTRAFDKAIKQASKNQAFHHKARKYGNYQPNFKLFGKSYVKGNYPIVIRSDRKVFYRDNSSGLVGFKLHFKDFFSVFIFKLAFVIILLNFIGLTNAHIQAKHYLAALDDSVVYYDVNINDGSITEASNANTLSAYTDNQGHIIQSVYTYDWFNKFDELKGLKPVFSYKDLPYELLNELKVPGSDYIYKYENIFNYNTINFSSLSQGVDNNNIEFYYDSDYLTWLLRLTENNSYNSVERVYVSSNINSWNLVVKNKIAFEDTFISKVYHFLSYPLTICYNIYFDSLLVFNFIFRW